MYTSCSYLTLVNTDQQVHVPCASSSSSLADSAAFIPYLLPLICVSSTTSMRIICGGVSAPVLHNHSPVPLCNSQLLP